MKGRDRSGLYRWRWAFCAAGAAAGLLLYAFRAGRLPRRAPAGVEQRLFSVEHVPIKLLEAPNGGRWIVTLEPPTSPPPAVPGSGVLPALFAESRPLLAAGQEGTWLLEGSSLRPVWRHPARGWADPSHLWTNAPASVSYPPDTLLLDLHTRRSQRIAGRPPGLKSVDEQESYPVPTTVDDAFSEPLAEDQVLRSTLAIGAIAWFDVGTRRVGLVAREDGTSPIYAVSDDTAPRSLLLSNRGIPLALSRDGRRMYSVRSSALWRLDLTQPLPGLLQRQTEPSLPVSGDHTPPGLMDPRVGPERRPGTPVRSR